VRWGAGTLEKEKPSIFGMVERGRRVGIQIPPHVQKATIKPDIQSTIARGSLIYTDEYATLTVWIHGDIHEKAFVMASEMRARTDLSLLPAISENSCRHRLCKAVNNLFKSKKLADTDHEVFRLQTLGFQISRRLPTATRHKSH
jgi:hypothetical protein